jgi:uncharacterized protein (TIGR02145 family)
MKHKSLGWVIFSAAVLAASCTKDGQVIPPVIQATVLPSSGNTTQTFSFDLGGSDSRNGKGAKVFTRWDWDGNGTWDTPFTRILKYNHRYYAPGTWKPRLEMVNLDGGSDTLTISVPVERGYSPPKIRLTISPEKGHPFTRFVLDASRTFDDEDSLNQLTYKWDFEGDGQWDTPFGDSSKISFQYPETGIYEPKLQVKDPSGLISSEKGKILVNLEDLRLFVGFRCIPDSVTHNTPIIMDASACSDLDNPDMPLHYRWDWNNDRIWDTEWLTNPKTEHIFKDEFFNYVRLQIRSFRGLTNEMVLKIRVYHRNQVPRASFAMSTLTGNVKTQFRFDCWSCRDVESSPSEMFYRWDFNGDGNWDTDFSHTVVTMHQYDKPGVYRALLQVQDPLGEQDTISKSIYVSHGTNQTDIFDDKRGDPYQSYGTVLIGDQWWFTRNMSIHDTTKFYQFYFNNSWPVYFDYGNLYLWGYVPGICPPGWRLPSREDWNILFANYPDDRLFDALMPGGESDFGVNLGGMGIGYNVPTAKYQGLDRYGYYWTSTKPAGATSTSVWVITFDKPNRQILKGYNEPGSKQFSVRCVKNK